MAVRIAIAIASALCVPAVANADCSLDRRIFGVPVWAASPNAGNTWGIMPIWMAVCPADKRTHWILAPSVTWNSIVHYTGTGRWFVYPDDDSTLSLVGSMSTRYAYRALVEWQRLSLATGDWTHEATLNLERDPFHRFFGIGPDSTADAETSYTGFSLVARGRLGRNIGANLNFGVTFEATHDRVDRIGIKGLPLAPDVFPDVPGMAEPSTLLAEGINLRYDDRVGGTFTERGTRVELGLAAVQGVRGSPNFLRGRAEASTVFPELDGMAVAAHVYWAGVSSSSVPFYAQSMLGGAILMRGFSEGRFVDRMAWTAELEQRIRVLQTSFFGVVTDWRIDPFVAVGQVYGSWSSIASNPRLSGGIGLRAWVHPSVLGRVDLAYAGEGLTVYVEMGYPY